MAIKIGLVISAILCIALTSQHLIQDDMKFRNFKMVDYVVYGRGCFNQLDEIIAPRRKETRPMIFLIDHFFTGKPLVNRIPLRGTDKIIFADVTY